MPPDRYISTDVDIAPLCQPLTFAFSKQTASNRLMKAATEEKLATWDGKILEKRGIPTTELIELYRRWGEQPDSWGVIITGNITIDFKNVAASGDPIITPECSFSGERFEGFKALATAGKAQGSLLLGQLNHPGRQVRYKYAKEAISASAIQLEPLFGTWTFGKPRAATEEDIEHIINSFAHAAEFLEKAGFDGINLHAAHGYLLAQFLSPRTNKRADSYGGSATKRAQLIIEIVQEIRRRVSSTFIISAKLNSTDFQEDGMTPSDARELVRVLQDEIGMDFIELSGGTYERLAFKHMKESTKKREAFFLEFAEMIVPGLGKDRKTKVYTTGGLRSVGAMVGALDVVDGVGLARPATQEPRLAADLIKGSVRGAIRPLAPFDTDTGLGFTAAGVQMKQIASGMEPMNLSSQDDIEIFRSIMKASMEKGQGQDTETETVGSPEWTGRSTPYGMASKA